MRPKGAGAVGIPARARRKGEGVVVRCIEEELVEARVELAVVGEAGSVEDGKHREGNRGRRAPGKAFERRIGEAEEGGREERGERQKPCRLAAEAQAAPDGERDIGSADAAAHVVVQPEDEKKATEREDCKVEKKYPEPSVHEGIKSLPIKQAGRKWLHEA